MKKALAVTLVLFLTISGCTVKKILRKNHDTSSSYSNSEKADYQRISYTRPSLDYNLRTDFLDKEGNIIPLVEVFEKDGIKATVEVNEKGELKASFSIPSDTIHKETSQKHTDVSSQQSSSVTTETISEKKGIGWPSFLWGALIAIGIILFLVIKFK